MGKIKHEIWTFTKAECSATVASAVDFGLAIILTYTNLLPYGWANMIGVVTGGLTNFTINSRYVFAGSGRRTRSLAMRYFVVWFGSMMINGFGTNAITWLIGGKSYFIFVKCIVACLVGFCFNYPLQRTWVFRRKKDLEL